MATMAAHDRELPETNVAVTIKDVRSHLLTSTRTVLSKVSSFASVSQLDIVQAYGATMRSNAISPAEMHLFSLVTWPHVIEAL